MLILITYILITFLVLGFVFCYQNRTIFFYLLHQSDPFLLLGFMLYCHNRTLSCYFVLCFVATIGSIFVSWFCAPCHNIIQFLFSFWRPVAIIGSKSRKRINQIEKSSLDVFMILFYSFILSLSFFNI